MSHISWSAVCLCQAYGKLCTNGGTKFRVDNSSVNFLLKRERTDRQWQTPVTAGSLPSVWTITTHHVISQSNKPIMLREKHDVCNHNRKDGMGLFRDIVWALTHVGAKNQPRVKRPSRSFAVVDIFDARTCSPGPACMCLPSAHGRKFGAVCLCEKHSCCKTTGASIPMGQGDMPP